MSTIVILPESNETTLCVRFHGRVIPDDFDKYFYQEIKRRAETNGFFNLVVQYGADFKGWYADAAEMNLKSIFELGTKPRRLAYIDPPERTRLLLKMAQPIVEGDVRYFEPGEYQVALDWIKETA